MDGRCADEVVIVEHEHKVLWDGRKFVDQERQNRFDCRRLWGLEHRRRRLADARLDRLQRGNEIGQKADRVIVSLVYRNPRDRNLALGEPTAHQRRLAKARRGRDEGEFVRKPAFKRSIRRGRRTHSGRAGGM